MNLDTTLKVLQIVLGEAKTTNDCDITTSYADSTSSSFTLGNNNVKSNGTTVVTVVAAPGDSATQRQVKEVRLFNNDTVSHTVTLQLYDGTSTWIIGPGKQTVPGGASFIYTPDSAVGASGSGVVLVVVQAGPFLASGTITTSGTINNSITSLTANAILLGAGTAAVAPLGSLGTATTVLHGNAAGPPAFGPVNLATDVSGLLPFANFATLAALSLFGNSGTVGAAGGNIAIGTNLSLTAGGTLNATVGTTTIAATSLFGNPGTVAAAGSSIAIGTNLTLSALGTLSSTAPGTGTVTQVVAQGGPFLANGTITASGTINNSTASLTPHGVLLGEGTGAAVATAAGTDGQLLIATSAADPAFTSMSGDATITKAGVIAVTKIGGATAATAANTGAVLTSGTVQINNSMTLNGTAGGTLTLAPTTGTTDVVINMPAAGGTVTLAYSGAFARQRMEVDIKQGVTAGALVLNVGTVNGYIFSTSLPSYTITPLPNSIDTLIFIAPTTAYTRVMAINQGFTS